MRPPEPIGAQHQLEGFDCGNAALNRWLQQRALANKAKDETALLKERITALASRDLPQRKELYELLEIVTAIAGDIEDAGDDLVNGFSRYKKGRHTFQGGGYLGDLKQKQQLIDKSKDLLGTPPVPPDGNGHGPAITTPPPPGDSVPGPIDVSTNGNQPQQEPQDQAKSGGKVTGSTGGKAGTAELQALEQRLVRLEHLVLLIAQQVGVAPDAIERLLQPAAPPT